MFVKHNLMITQFALVEQNCYTTVFYLVPVHLTSSIKSFRI